MKLVMKSWISLCLIIALVLTVSVITSAQMGKYDLGGQTVRMGIVHNTSTPLGTDLDWYNPDARLQKHIEAVEEAFNCKIEILTDMPRQGAAIVEWLIPQLLIGEAPLEIVEVRIRDLFPLAINGLIRPVDDLATEELISQYSPGVWQGQARVAGRLYGLPRLLAQLGMPDVGDAIVWNKDIFEQEGLPNLYEVFEAGDWTWDVFTDIAIALTRDTDGDGTIDRYGLRSAYSGVQQYCQWLPTNNATTTRVVDGRVKLALHEPAAIETFEFVQNLILKGVVGGRRGASPMEHVWSDGVQYDQYQQSDWAWGIVPLPRGPQATEHRAPHQGGWVMAIPITTPNPREVLEVYNALMQLTVPYWGGETVEERDERMWREDRRARIAFDRESVEFMRWTALNMEVIPDYTLLEQAGLLDATRRMSAGDPVSSVIGQIVPSLEAMIDEVYKQK